MNSWRCALPAWLQFLHPQVLRGRCIIVERCGGIGDVICLLPALAALRRKHPDCRIIMITSRSCVPLVRSAQVVDVVLPAGTRGLAWLRKSMRPQLDIQPLLPDEQSPPKPRASIHLMEEFARSLDVAGEPLSYPQLVPSARDRARVVALLGQAGLDTRRLVIIHTGPTWPVKQWPLEHWNLLVEQLTQISGVAVIQAGANGHASDAQAITPCVLNALDWIGRLSLSETLALIAQAQLFVGVDSGLLHVANALRVPTLGLFGPTDPACFMPPGQSEHGLRSSMPCIACHHHPDGPLHWQSDCPQQRQCMSALSVDHVLKHSLALLS